MNHKLKVNVPVILMGLVVLVLRSFLFVGFWNNSLGNTNYAAICHNFNCFILVFFSDALF